MGAPGVILSVWGRDERDARRGSVLTPRVSAHAAALQHEGHDTAVVGLKTAGGEKKPPLSTESFSPESP